MRPIKKSSRSTESSSWFGFLRLDADLALTFIESAKIHSDPKRAALALARARRALEEIQRRLAKPAVHHLSQEELELLEKRCLEITSEAPEKSKLTTTRLRVVVKFENTRSLLRNNIHKIMERCAAIAYPPRPVRTDDDCS